MICAACAHSEVCRYVETRSNGSYCTSTECLQYLPKTNIIDCPCFVGQTVWFIRDKYKKKFEETFVEKVILKSGGIYIKLACNATYETSCRSIGKTVFLSKEAVEQAINNL